MNRILKILFIVLLGFTISTYSLNIPGLGHISNAYTVFRQKPLWKQMGIAVASVYTASLMANAAIILADKAGNKWAHKINKKHEISKSWNGAFQRMSTFLFEHTNTF